jgi:hypothetical protein
MDETGTCYWWAFPKGKRKREFAKRVRAVTLFEARRLGAEALRLRLTDVWAEIDRREAARADGS